MIIDLAPCNYISRIELAIEIQRSINNIENPKILEIGTGEGDSTKYILEYNKNTKIDSLDISPEMIDLAKKHLEKEIERVNFIQDDVLEYLENTEKYYDIITFSWVVHNFKKEEQRKIFEKIYKRLVSGGKMIIMEKLYPDSAEETKAMYNHQMQRYRDYLPDDLSKEIIEHETLDLSPDYLMQEGETINVLKNIGFRNMKVADRVEQVVILIAER